jgi:predicted MFS family arabinose efflux permease
VFFLLRFFHSADKFLIVPLTTPIIDDFGINEAQMGAVVTGALIVATIFYCF